MRKTILAGRDAMTRTVREEKSRVIRDRVLTMTELSRASCVMIYVNYRSEVITRPLIAELQGLGKTVAAPVTDPHNARLLPYIVGNEAEDLIPGYCNIPEPDSGSQPSLDPGRLDIVLVPGSVFDPDGNRLGYGGGYYDRFLSQEAPQALTVGLAFEMQIVDSVPVQDHDIPLDLVITEKRVVHGDKES
ncbi:MAG: 5-formyltetrahydrofolate cyclo-ligase [Desulfurivibrionaceae bacterium]